MYSVVNPPLFQKTYVLGRNVSLFYLTKTKNSYQIYSILRYVNTLRAFLLIVDFMAPKYELRNETLECAENIHVKYLLIEAFFCLV